ncbi:hypothetical protein K8640_29830 [Myxococcus sp. XM-1-1-1]|jgi:hypothetical protein|uniref:hypothetical protein n=1 Tax=Myxococcus sp. XM-1-1-1 TaxID=2874602 RepID=UPI001CBD43E0|nr:hypothetical protein [Myxococcus sp. XM-1-1-1]MBZ4412431.1 hypothetical protein [Myxococcus sp. XM-1-1-1]
MFQVLAGILAAAGVAGSPPVPEAPPDAAAELARACTTLTAPGNRRANVCKTWTAMGGGVYRGTWSTSSHASGTRLQFYADGYVFNAAWSGEYSGVQRFLLRLCNTSTGRCSAWW